MPGYRRGLRLPGSVVAVTGAAGAVGAPVAEALAAAGATPVLLDARDADLAPVTARCARRGRPALVRPVDLADADDVAAAAREAVAHAGRLDGWVQCVAGAAGADGSLTRLSPAALRAALDGAVLGAAHGARAAVAEMAAGGGGVLAVVVGVHGQVARPHGAPDAMASAAVRAMAGALRQELRLDGVRGVAVTAVLVPGPGSVLRTRPGRVAATVLGRLRHPGLEKVAGGPLAKAVVHGHALVPAATEWWVAHRSRR